MYNFTRKNDTFCFATPTDEDTWAPCSLRNSGTRGAHPGKSGYGGGKMGHEKLFLYQKRRVLARIGGLNAIYRDVK